MQGALGELMPELVSKFLEIHLKKGSGSLLDERLEEGSKMCLCTESSGRGS